MNIRLASSSDTAAIVALLKESLGESLLKKSIDIWTFKHEQNPFGTSHVLVAEEDDQIIGVRAFMQWRWQEGEQIWQAYRAVDTATHPAHQGKGIFKKLTLQAVKDVGKNKDCFIFNTPNDQSRPGYLKMGWEVLSKIRIALVPAIWYGFRYAFHHAEKYYNNLLDEELEALCVQHNERLRRKGVFFTPKSAGYLQWRYTDNPMQSYTVVHGKNWYIAVYVKKRAYFKELRIAELIGASDTTARKEIQIVVSALARKYRCLLISTTESGLFSFRYFGRLGPLLTCRDLTADNHVVEKSKQSGDWNYAMGDLELF